MTTTAGPSLATRRLARFDLVQRAAHWANATLFTVLIVTAVPLYFGSFFGLILPRHTVEQIHLWSGLALPLPLVLSLIGRWGRQMRRDMKRFNRWTHEEIVWLRSLGRSPLLAEKFNPGQKLNAAFVGASILVMLATGSMLQWFRFFSVSQREGATFVHDTFAAALVVVIVGHLFMAFTHRDSLGSMVDGKVSEDWAKMHAPLWSKEAEDGENS